VEERPLVLKKISGAGITTDRIIERRADDDFIRANACHGDPKIRAMFVRWLILHVQPRRSCGESGDVRVQYNFYLTTVTAADGVTFSLSFSNDYPVQVVTGITASYGPSVWFYYASGQYSDMLTNITDAAGISSQISYIDPTWVES